MGKHLKDKQYYIDLYDKHTVEKCRSLENHWKDRSLTDKEDGEITEQARKAINDIAMDFCIRQITGERYLDKENTISEWMTRDEHRDNIYENTQPPENIRCLTCRNRMNVSTKVLDYNLDKPDRMLFIFECPNKCLPNRAFFSDGEELRTKPKLCPNCNISLESKDEKIEYKIITTYSCNRCDYSKKEELDISPKEEEPFDENFAKDRDRFCLTQEEGEKYQKEKFDLQQLARFSEEWKKKEEEKAKKLEENPNGYHLDGSGYTCYICGRSTPEGDNWYDKYGIKCLVCQKAIDESEIPATLASDKDSWYTKYDLEKSFCIKNPTLRKWIRDGIIKPRIVSHYGKGTWYELFMIEDNKDFLPPKKLVESESVNVKDENGKIERKSIPWYQLHKPHEHLKGYKIMDHLRVVPAEEMKEREEKEKKKLEEKLARRKNKNKIK